MADVVYESNGVLVNHPVRQNMLPQGTHVFTQSACISHGVPLHVSNIQETEFLF